MVFGKEQWSFKCQEKSDYEDGTFQEFEIGRNGRYIMSERDVSMPELLRRWYDMVELYTQRSLWAPSDIHAALAGLSKLVQQRLGSRNLAGLWETDMHRGLLWKSRQLVFGPYTNVPLKMPRKRIPETNSWGDQLTRAPSWSWASVEGPVFQQLQRKTVKDLEDFANLRCWPLDKELGRWTQDEVSTNLVNMSSCELQLYGTLRKVKCSKTSPAAFRRVQWQYSLAKIKEHCVLLEPCDGSEHLDEDGDSKTVVAVGMFDVLRLDTPFWCMPLTIREGLMLMKNPEGHFSRVGVFSVEEQAFFDQGSPEEIRLV